MVDILVFGVGVMFDVVVFGVKLIGEVGICIIELFDLVSWIEVYVSVMCICWVGY